MNSPTLVCSSKMLPQELWIEAARVAATINPANRPAIHRLGLAMPEFVPSPERLAVLMTKYWGAGGVKLTVGFLDNPPADLRKRLLSHMNAWSNAAKVEFSETSTDPQVRIARTPGEGYWSYLGTDVLVIPRQDQTMNLDSFTMETEDTEFYRVVRHETGHTLGFPHEHMRRELVNRLDRDKVITYFREHYGWSESMTVAQVLTPLEEAQLMATAHADELSIMCYQLPGVLTKDGKPILGGLDIDPSDYEFAAKLYPKS